MVGDDQLYEFAFNQGPSGSFRAQIFTGTTCEVIEQQCATSLFISNSSLNNLFFAAEGITYLIRITADDFNDIGSPFSFDLNCRDRLVNDICDGAIEITCDSSITGSLELASGNFVQCNNAFGSRPGLWYSFHSDGTDIYEINYDSELRDKLVFIYEGNCSALVCVDFRRNFGDSPISEILVLPAGNYYIFAVSYTHLTLPTNREV